MHLLFSKDEYLLNGVPRRGFPIILWEDMQSCWEANEFLRYYLTRGAIGSALSWQTVARSIYDYFGFLEAHKLDWRDVHRGEGKNLVAGYRDYCFDIVKLSRNTIRLRLVYVCEFYEFALRQGWIARLPFTLEKRYLRQSGGFLAHTSATGGTVDVRSVMPRKCPNLVKYLTRTEAEKLLGAAENIHHKAIIRLALGAGLRRGELATFPLAYVFDPDKANIRSRNVRVTLDPDDGSGMQTKGSRTRVIYMPSTLMKYLHRYALHHRGSRASLSSEDHKQLFLNQNGHPWSCDGKGLEAMVRGLGKKLGFRVHPHMLRHTYATHMLIALQGNRKENRIEPLVFLQRQMGHASIRSTMMYLHLVNELAEDAVLTYDEELNDLDSDFEA